MWFLSVLLPDRHAAAISNPALPLAPILPVAALPVAITDAAQAAIDCQPPVKDKSWFKNLHLMFKYLKRAWLDKNDYFNLYYFQLLGEYQTLRIDRAQPGQAHLACRAETIFQKWVQFELEWHDIFELESIILELLPLDKLRRRAWDLRAKYKQMVTPATYDAYLNSKPPDPDSPDPSLERDLRSDLSRLLADFHWQYGLTLARESTRASISLWQTITLGVVILFAIGGFVWWASSPATYPPFPIALGVFITGMIGGFVSTQLRLQNIKPSGAEPIEELVQLNQGKAAIIVAPTLGGIFAVILYVIFAGNFLKSDIFPIISGALPTPHLETFWQGTGPTTVVDAARLLVWSFLAGFAERLVPDALDRIAATNTAVAKNS